jgi:hypothetical protein
MRGQRKRDIVALLAPDVHALTKVCVRAAWLRVSVSVVLTWQIPLSVTPP